MINHNSKEIRIGAISKAAEQLEQNAQELKDAFQFSDGTFLEEDADIRHQIIELEQSAVNLWELSATLNSDHDN